MSDSKHYDRQQAADYLGVSYKTLEVWARDRKHLPYFRNGRKVMYRRADLDAHIERTLVQPADLDD